MSDSESRAEWELAWAEYLRDLDAGVIVEDEG